MGVLLMPHAETLQGTETKAAAATLVHTSIQTFSHLASGTLLRGWSGDLSAFGKDPNRFQANPCLLYLIVPLTHVQLFCMSQAATPKGTTEMQRSGIFAKQLFSTLHDTSDDEAPMTYSMK